MHQVDKYGLSDPSLAIILSNEAITKKKCFFRFGADFHL